MNDRKKNRPRGRPKVSGVCKLSKAVTVKFSKIDYERLCRRSRQANLTLAEFLRVSAFETTITARHSAEETAVIRSLTGMANNLNQLTRLSHQAGFHRTQRIVTELLQRLLSGTGTEKGGRHDWQNQEREILRRLYPLRDGQGQRGNY